MENKVQRTPDENQTFYYSSPCGFFLCVYAEDGYITLFNLSPKSSLVRKPLTKPSSARN
uniref:Uncharacterized protein n=1 Tax=Solanum tuberosum TaxID=4113 RepID=M1CBP3_SOLTU